jgi:hypothetical protein
MRPLTLGVLRRRATVAVALVSSLAVGFATSASPATAAGPACAPPALNHSAALAGSAVTVSPAPATMDASYLTQISFLGVPAAEITDVKVVGSRSGSHSGRLLAYSQGDGASFVPGSPFSQGERVTVHAVLHSPGRATPFGWSFAIAVVDAVSRSLETPPGPPPAPKQGELQHFVSRSDLKPPTVAVTANSGQQALGDVFLAPYAGPGQYGPMILDGAGKLIWFKPLPAGTRAADLRVQEYDGKPVLSWWQSPLVAGGRRDAGIVIADSSYRTIAIVRAGNRYQPDLHSFQITPQGTAFTTVYDAIRCNLSGYGGPADGAVADTLLQELDLKTGLVRFEWHSLDHVALADSYMPVRPGGSPRSPWDYFHINSIDPAPGGNLLVDSRNTWAAYQVDKVSGKVLWRLGGKHSSFALGAGARPAWQHDAVTQPDGTITFFDNGATPKAHPQSRGIVLHVDLQQKTASLLASFVHPTPLVAPSQGNLQALAGGDHFLGWGQSPYFSKFAASLLDVDPPKASATSAEPHWFLGWGESPYFSEFAAGAQLLFDAHLPSAYQSYTAFKFPWAAAPPQGPAIAVRARAHTGPLVYASWNGATAVTSWRVLAGSAAHALSPVGEATRSGFETTIALSRAARYVAVQGLDAEGHVLATSATSRT